jgi:hypothetical protein
LKLAGRPALAAPVFRRIMVVQQGQYEQDQTSTSFSLSRPNITAKEDSSLSICLIALAYRAIHSTHRSIATPACPFQSMSISLHRRPMAYETGKHNTAMIEPINKSTPLLLAEEHCSNAERVCCRKIQRGIVSQPWQPSLPEIKRHRKLRIP